MKFFYNISIWKFKCVYVPEICTFSLLTCLTLDIYIYTIILCVMCVVCTLFFKLIYTRQLLYLFKNNYENNCMITLYLKYINKPYKHAL